MRLTQLCILQAATCLVSTLSVVTLTPVTEMMTTPVPLTGPTEESSSLKVTTEDTKAETEMNNSKKDKAKEEDDENVGKVAVTEQIMNPQITLKNLPDVEEGAVDEDVPVESRDPSWDVKRAVRDIAYYLRAHKFQDYDRRYYRSAKDAVSRLYEEFPDPPLRSPHWDVRRHCDVSFHECLRFLERIVKLTALRRQDDTVTVIREQKWNPTNNSEQIQAAQRNCQMAQSRENLTMLPFEGPIERFQWRTTASYYMCWYTMQEVEELAVFGESCDNHANCLDEYGIHNGDPRADDAKPYACALYSFCPDHCCPMKHTRSTEDCYQSQMNPCYAENEAGHRKCSLQRVENRALEFLQRNRINVSCECSQTGFEWSSMFGMCVDVNECVRKLHNCSAERGECCVNLPGYFDCICRLGYVYSQEMKHCVHNPILMTALGAVKSQSSDTDARSLLEKIIDVIAPTSRAPTHRYVRFKNAFRLTAIVTPFLVYTS